MSRLDLYSIDDANDLSHQHGGWTPDGEPFGFVRSWSRARWAGYVLALIGSGVLLWAIVSLVLATGSAG